MTEGKKYFEYYKYSNGALTLNLNRETVIHFNHLELDKIIARQLKLKNEGGRIIGAFDNEKLVGVVSVEQQKRGVRLNYCKMDILYVSRNYRGMGVGQILINKSKKVGREFGADKLYISATPTRNTVDFYLRSGAILASELDKELFNIEPEDIHLELNIETTK